MKKLKQEIIIEFGRQLDYIIASLGAEKDDTEMLMKKVRLEPTSSEKSLGSASPSETKICAICSKKIEKPLYNQKFCSTKCKKIFHRPYDNETGKKRFQRDRKEAMEKVCKGEMWCAICGVEDDLEINHINGGGRKEVTEEIGRWNFYRSIINGKRTVADLNILCKRCNWEDYLKRTNKKSRETPKCEYCADDINKTFLTSNPMEHAVTCPKSKENRG